MTTAIQPSSRLARMFRFSGRASRTEYWRRFALSLGLMFLFQLAFLPVAVIALSGEAWPRQDVTPDEVPIFLLLFGSISVFCTLMLPTVARRFQDHGWSGAWFQLNFRIGIPTVLVGATLFSVGVIVQHDAVTWGGFFLGFLAGFVTYASVIWTFWIGFVRPDPGANKFGPRPGADP